MRARGWGLRGTGRHNASCKSDSNPYRHPRMPRDSPLSPSDRIRNIGPPARDARAASIPDGRQRTRQLLARVAPYPFAPSFAARARIAPAISLATL